MERAGSSDKRSLRVTLILKLLRLSATDNQLIFSPPHTLKVVVVSALPCAVLTARSCTEGRFSDRALWMEEQGEIRRGLPVLFCDIDRLFAGRTTLCMINVHTMTSCGVC